MTLTELPLGAALPSGGTASMQLGIKAAVLTRLLESQDGGDILAANPKQISILYLEGLKDTVSAATL